MVATRFWRLISTWVQKNESTSELFMGLWTFLGMLVDWQMPYLVLVRSWFLCSRRFQETQCLRIYFRASFTRTIQGKKQTTLRILNLCFSTLERTSKWSIPSVLPRERGGYSMQVRSALIESWIWWTLSKTRHTLELWSRLYSTIKNTTSSARTKDLQ